SFLIKKDHINYKKSHIHLGDFVASRVEFFDEVARINELNFDLVVPKEDLFIYFSDAKLMRLVDNTLSNAIKYTPAQNTITVRIAKEVQGVLFLVSSKSKSIEDTKRLFEQFYRESSEVDGFGIGLSLVKSICVEEGVEVSVDSDETQTSFRYEFV
ncbi:MAG: ATP-binding protein, partial [Sulfuricurvum sp.]